MDLKLQIGLEGMKSETVTAANTAIAYGSGGVAVYATPAMIGLMEGACLSAVDPLLDEGTATVGTAINVSHLAATPLGMQVRAKAKLVDIAGKRLTFTVEAYDEKEKIGEGRHERYIIHLDKFLQKTAAKA
jgi:predicted thioesterase